MRFATSGESVERQIEIVDLLEQIVVFSLSVLLVNETLSFNGVESRGRSFEARLLVLEIGSEIRRRALCTARSRICTETW